MTEQNVAPKPAAGQAGARDLLARLYREIGISAVAAALESSVAKPKKAAPLRKAEIPAVLRDEEAA